MDPVTDDYSTIRADDSMESPCPIKTFIMGAVFEYLIYPNVSETPSSDYETSLKPLLNKMITDNDNFSADNLVKLLGNGDFNKVGSLSTIFANLMDFPAQLWVPNFWKKILLPVTLQVPQTAADFLQKSIKEIW